MEKHDRGDSSGVRLKPDNRTVPLSDFAHFRKALSNSTGIRIWYPLFTML